MAKPVLVTSAAGGRQGKTGRHVSEMLLKRGIPVRAFVHAIDERSDQLRALGAEIFEGDFLDVRSVKRAVQDVSSVYFAYPVQDGLLDATAAMAVAARQAGITRLVNLVMLQSSVDAPTPRMRQNYLSEQVFEWASIGAVHVRATVFYENLGSQVRLSLPAQGAVRLPWGKENTVLPLVAAEDVARVDGGHRLSGDRHRHFAEGDYRDLRARSRQGRALRRDLGRRVAPRRACARLQCACTRASLRALEGAPRRRPRPGAGPLRGDRYDRKTRRRQTQDVRDVRPRRPRRIDGENRLT